MLTISKRTLVQLLALAMGGVGLALVVGVVLGSQLAPTEVVEADTAGAQIAPVAAHGPAAPLACELTPVHAPEELALLDHIARDTVGSTNSATNSGTIDGSQFSDGGFGDIGQQWWNVTVGGDVTNVHVSGNGNVVATNDAVIAPPAPTPAEPAPTTTAPPAATTTSTSAPTTTSTTTPVVSAPGI